MRHGCDLRAVYLPKATVPLLANNDDGQRPTVDQEVTALYPTRLHTHTHIPPAGWLVIRCRNARIGRIPPTSIRAVSRLSLELCAPRCTVSERNECMAWLDDVQIYSRASKVRPTAFAADDCPE
uniref:Uncharacterized protein n=1 Tax=Plectus sambesii TaxID=2011161 RepID=A0A914XGH5_9BILA